MWQNSETQIWTKHNNPKNLKIKLFCNNNLTPWLPMICFWGTLLQSSDALYGEETGFPWYFCSASSWFHSKNQSGHHPLCCVVGHYKAFSKKCCALNLYHFLCTKKCLNMYCPCPIRHGSWLQFGMYRPFPVLFITKIVLLQKLTI